MDKNWCFQIRISEKNFELFFGENLNIQNSIRASSCFCCLTGVPKNDFDVSRWTFSARKLFLNNLDFFGLWVQNFWRMLSKNCISTCPEEPFGENYKFITFCSNCERTIFGFWAKNCRQVCQNCFLSVWGSILSNKFFKESVKVETAIIVKSPEKKFTYGGNHFLS